MDDMVLAAREVQAKSVMSKLEAHGFEPYWAASAAEARAIVAGMVPADASVAWGGSATFTESGVKAMLEERGCTMVGREEGATEEERHRAFMATLDADFFFMSANAVTLNGELVNIDGNSNRLAALLHGPRHVVVVAGMNKVVRDVEAGIERTRTQCCPVNATRLGTGTPCQKLGVCPECHAENCMCCNVVVSRHNRARGRIKVILVGENLGF